MKPHRLRPILLVLLIPFTSSCAITMKPDLVEVPRAERPPVVRLGTVTETVTGTWNIYPSAGFKADVQDALSQAGPASRFSNDLSNLTMEIHLISDHEDDGPRLGSLGGLSIVTLGIIPLNYFSEWNIDGEIKLRRSDDTLVANYHVSEKATYEIWAYPLTMFTLFGAGIRGDGDARTIAKKISNNLAAKVVAIIDNNYDELARLAGHEMTGRVTAARAAASAGPEAVMVT